MRRRRLLLMLAGLVCLAALAWGIMAMLPTRPGVTVANFDRIKEGMTAAEVRAIFDGPNLVPKYTNAKPIDREWVFWTGANVGGTVLEPCQQQTLQPDGSGFAMIYFENDVVIRKDWSPGEPFLNKLRRWLHLP